MGVLNWLLGTRPPETAAQEFQRILRLAEISPEPAGRPDRPVAPARYTDVSEAAPAQLDKLIEGLLADHAREAEWEVRAVRQIGLEIFDEAGHDGMAKAFMAVSRACGPEAAQSLSKHWNRIGDWRS